MELTIEQKAKLFDKLNEKIMNNELRVMFGAGYACGFTDELSCRIGATICDASDFICSETGYAGILVNPDETLKTAFGKRA